MISKQSQNLTKRGKNKCKCKKGLHSNVSQYMPLWSTLSALLFAPHGKKEQLGAKQGVLSVHYLKSQLFITLGFIKVSMGLVNLIAVVSQ